MLRGIEANKRLNARTKTKETRNIGDTATATIEYIPGKTDNGCRACPDRNGGGYGGSCDGSWPLEIEDGGEIIDGSSLAAITWMRPALKIFSTIS